MTKRITIQQGDYILLSDIPNEEVFNLVKGCFRNAGFSDKSPMGTQFAQYNERLYWEVILLSDTNIQSFDHLPDEDSYEYPIRKITLSDVLNSTNGGYEWNGYKVINFPARCAAAIGMIRVEKVEDTTPETSWYVQGDLPPIDTVCEYRFPNPDVSWTEVRVNYISEKHAILTCLRDGLECHTDGFKSYDFRPINEERKRVISDALSKLTMFRSAKQVLGELYDAGMLKGI